MTEPRVPGSGGDAVELPCGERVAPADLDMGMREFDCDCGASHAVVMDVHPATRFLPADLVEQLREAVETADDLGPFGAAHLLGMVMEEFPEAVASADVAEDGSVGYAMLWVTDFDARRLHEVVVELVVELMEHAMSHADDANARQQFEGQMREFDVGAFVDRYRAARDFEDEHDTPV